jgi:DNA-binding transcriptional MocR family regulator
LPPVRDLAVELDINRNTVAAAYKRLVTAGIALTQGRLGTIIRDQSGPGEQEGALSDSPLADLASGNPNPAWLPDLSAALAIRPYQPRLYGEPTVNAGLESYARAWFARDCPAPFEINLTHGAVDAIERLLSSHLVAGDKVAVENPCFLSSINMLRIAGLQALGVPVDAEGMQAAALEAALAKGAQAVILTPRAHNPTGCSLSEKRAKALARVLAKYPHAMVIVDDHYALLSGKEYHSVLPSGIQRWALVRSFSKTLGPDVRLAMVASDTATSRQLRLRLASGTSWVSHLLQDMVEVTLGRPEVAKQMAQARKDYAQRRKALEGALSEQGVPYAADGDGLNLWVPLDTDDQAVALALAHRGWLVRHGDAFGVQEPVRGLRITVSAIEPGQCRKLARDIRESMV